MKPALQITMLTWPSAWYYFVYSHSAVDLFVFPQFIAGVETCFECKRLFTRASGGVDGRKYKILPKTDAVSLKHLAENQSGDLCCSRVFCSISRISSGVTRNDSLKLVFVKQH